MSDRVSTLTVILDSSLKDEDAQKIADAISLMCRVVAVKLNVDSINDAVIRARLRREFLEKMWGALGD